MQNIDELSIKGFLNKKLEVLFLSYGREHFSLIVFSKFNRKQKGKNI